MSVGGALTRFHEIHLKMTTTIWNTGIISHRHKVEDLRKN